MNTAKVQAELQRQVRGLARELAGASDVNTAKVQGCTSRHIAWWYSSGASDVNTAKVQGPGFLRVRTTRGPEPAT